jgi:hypothetical protein
MNRLMWATTVVRTTTAEATAAAGGLTAGEATRSFFVRLGRGTTR